MVVLKALVPISIDGRIVEVGNEFSCSTDYAKKLIDGKSAEKVEPVKNDEVNPEREKLESKTKDELLEIVEEKGIEGIDKSNKKPEIIDAILKEAEKDEL